MSRGGGECFFFVFFFSGSRLSTLQRGQSLPPSRGWVREGKGMEKGEAHPLFPLRAPFCSSPFGFRRERETEREAQQVTDRSTQLHTPQLPPETTPKDVFFFFFFFFTSISKKKKNNPANTHSPTTHSRSETLLTCLHHPSVPALVSRRQAVDAALHVAEREVAQLGTCTWAERTFPFSFPSF